MNSFSTDEQREDFARKLMQEFRPIVNKLGFGLPRWEYDQDSETLRVQFEDRKHESAVQIDYSVDKGSYSANYCQNEGEWQICTEGRPDRLSKLKGILTEWLLEKCEDCCVDCEPAESWEEYATVPCSHCDDSGHVPKVSA
jgi:hypothetical protein